MILTFLLFDDSFPRWHSLPSFTVASSVDLKDAFTSHSLQNVFQHKFAYFHIMLVEIIQHFQHTHLFMVLQHIIGTLLHRPTASRDLMGILRHSRSKFLIGFLLRLRQTPLLIQMFVFNKLGALLSSQSVTSTSFLIILEFNNLPFLKFFQGFLEDEFGDVNVRSIQTFFNLVEFHTVLDARSL